MICSLGPEPGHYHQEQSDYRGAPRLGIVGAGAIGCVVGGLLTKAGHDVTFIEEPRSARADAAAIRRVASAGRRHQAACPSSCGISTQPSNGTRSSSGSRSTIGASRRSSDSRTPSCPWATATSSCSSPPIRPRPSALHREERRGAGVYLVGFECQDIPGSVSKLRADGARVNSPRPDLAWVHPREAHGLFVELRKPEKLRLAMATFRFELHDLPPEAEALRGEVREFLREELKERSPLDRAPSWGSFDREFSLKVGARGWIGLTWPKQYGGHERSALERYVVMEEMLAAGGTGCPRTGSPTARAARPCCISAPRKQRQRFLPTHRARRASRFAIGMSQPDSGSDLASLRTRAEKVVGRLTRSTARRSGPATLTISDYMIATLRTHVDPPQQARGALSSSSSTPRPPASPSAPSSTSPASTTSTRSSFRTPSSPRTCWLARRARAGSR